MPDRYQWIFLSECGCPFGVMEDSGHTRGEAWKDFYDAGTPARTTRAIGVAVAEGVTTMKVEHSRYVSEFMPMMRSEFRCPHVLGAALEPCTTASRLKRHLSRDLSAHTFAGGGTGTTLCGRAALDEHAARLAARPVTLSRLTACGLCATAALGRAS